MYVSVRPAKLKRLNPASSMSNPQTLTSRAATRPVRPSVARKAKASGTPAKFDATPEKVMSVGRTQAGRPPEIAAYARKNPNRAPPIADTARPLMLIRDELRPLG